MAGSYPQPKRDLAFYIKLAQMDLELIMEQRDEISRLKQEVNNLRQKLKARK